MPQMIAEDDDGPLARCERDPADLQTSHAFDHLLELARLMLDVPNAALGLCEGAPSCVVAPRARDAVGPIAELTIATADVISVADSTNHPRFQAQRHHAGPMRIGGQIAAPVVVEGRVVAVLSGWDAKPRTFDQTARVLITNLADCAAHEIRLHTRVSHDDLTGFLTRNAFFARLEAAHGSCARAGTPAALAFLDLDHFKALNDNHGHDVGDAVLRAVAEACRDTLDPQAVCGRIGGEEFAILIPHDTLEEATRKLEKVKAAIAALALPDGPALSVTGSIGVCAFNRTIASVSVWCKMADAALYGAKHSGRNALIVFQDALGLPSAAPRPARREAADSHTQARHLEATRRACKSSNPTRH